MKILSCVLAAVVILINMYFVWNYVTESFSPEWYVILGVSIFGVCYLAFCAYLILHVIASMGCSWFEGSMVSCTIKANYYFLNKRSHLYIDLNNHLQIMRKILHDNEPRILENANRGESYGYDENETDDDDNIVNRGLGNGNSDAQ